MTEKLLVPDIGEFQNVEVIELLVKEGQEIEKNDPVITIESDKSSVEIPSTVQGTIDTVNVKIGDTVSKGDLILNLTSGNITAPFSGVIGYAGLTEDIFISDNIFIITLDDNSTIYSDIKIPENYAPFIKKGLPV